MASALTGMDMSAGMPDYCMMDSVSEDSFMDNTRERFKKDRIYTLIGEQVVSVNPFRRFPDLYSDETMEGYRNRYMYEVPPHIYALGDDTFRQMMQNKSNQCVIITGESGAGKTEASKILMQYISRISRGGDAADQIKNKLLESNPVLEAFGNAKTLRNDNSSRFGKYMEIMFDLGGAPVGGQIIQYLLEKGRVVTRHEGERSFHIFYFLLSQKHLLGDLKLEADPSKYHYLALSHCYTVDNMNDSSEFKLVEKAMRILGWTEGDMANVWKILAAILHIGNIDYEEGRSKNVATVTIKDMSVVEVVAGLLDIEVGFLERALTARTISTGVGRKTSTITVPLDYEQAKHTRDAMAKALYTKLFDWVIEVINKNIELTGKNEVSIGMLDIYGFEIFDSNSFEQFCINYCNEKLQQLFIRLVLQQEQEEYNREGIEWTDIDYFDNSSICELVDKKPHGLFSYLDEACLMGNSTTETVLDKFETNFKDHPNFESFKTTKDKGIGRTSMRIKHYAGDVCYNLEEFMHKNLDTLYHDLLAALQVSNNDLIQTLFPESMGKSNKRPPTAGTQFKKAVNDLIATLAACQPHYIRCIKSNDNKQAGGFDEERIRHQVRYLNLVETVRVRRAGFCNRQPYERFLGRYKMLSNKTWPTWTGSDREGVETILKDLGVSEDEFRLGNTKLFTRNAKTLFFYEDTRLAELPKVVILVQTAFRGFKAFKWYKEYKGALALQTAFRGYKQWKWYKEYKAASVVRAAWLRHVEYEKYKRHKAAVQFQKAYRGYKAHKWLRQTFAARVIQKCWRGYMQRVDWAAKKEEYRARREEMLRKLKERAAVNRVRLLYKTHKIRMTNAENAARARLRLMAATFTERRAKAKEAATSRLCMMCGAFMRREQQKKEAARERIIVGFKTWAALRKKMALRIAGWQVMMKQAHYFVELIDLFGDVKKDKTLGRHKKFPPPWPRNAEIQPIIERIHVKWWVYFRLAPLDELQRRFMRQKVLGYDLFGNGKKKWDCARKWTADYLGVPMNQNKDKYDQAVQSLFQQGGDTTILFADYVTKINSGGKGDRRCTIVTEMHLYKYGLKNFKQKKFHVTLESIKSIHCSPRPEDQIIVFKCEPPFRDVVFDMGTQGADRVSEIATVVVQAIKDRFDRDLVVEFSEKLTFNNGRDLPKKPGKDLTMVFAKNPKPKEDGLCVYQCKKDVVTCLFP